MPVNQSAGKALKKAFRQEDMFEGIEPQFAKVSLLMNTSRMRLFTYLLDNPCQHLRGISRATGFSAPTVSWHLKKLLHSGYIEAGKLGRKNVFWVTGMVSRSDVERFAIFNNQKYARIIKFAMAAEDGFRERDLVGAGDDDQQLVNIRLKKLVELHLLRREGTGLHTRFFLADTVKQMNARYMARASHMSDSLVTVFGADGLRPKIVRKRGQRLTLELMLPQGKTVMTMNCNPMRPFLRRVK